jgi:molybdopterin-guanine dinucleotide biosynthesis protein A
MFSIMILAGGESKRMGTDKGLTPFLGKPLIERVVERLAPIAREIVITTNRPQNYKFLDVRLVNDAIPGRGPLGGLLTAFIEATFPIVGVVACDMPFVNPQLLVAQRDKLVFDQLDLVVPETELGLEPFHAIYRRDTCLLPVIFAIWKGKWRANAWFHKVRQHRFSTQEIRLYDPELISFCNVNTPQELQDAAQFAIQQGK